MEVDLFGLRVFRFRAFLFALDKKVDRFGRFFGFLGRLRRFLAEGAVADKNQLDRVYGEKTDREE